MIFGIKKHSNNLYNILLNLSRNIFFYKNIQLEDTYETRIYLMFFHLSILMIISKNKGNKFNQDDYDNLFHNIENNLRELGFGDVSVNKKMKDLNKVSYDILLKIKLSHEDKNTIKFNQNLFSKYFKELSDQNNSKYLEIETYFINFYNFCSKLPLDKMIKQAINFKH